MVRNAASIIWCSEPRDARVQSRRLWPKWAVRFGSGMACMVRRIPAWKVVNDERIRIAVQRSTSCRVEEKRTCLSVRE